jgi:uncharacterized protein involved in propanediol utilization
MTELRTLESVAVAEPAAGALRSGHARCIAHHGELLQGAFTGPAGPTLALVTLPCPAFATDVSFHPAPFAELVVGAAAPDGREHGKALKAARLTLEVLGAPDIGGVIRIKSDIARGRGLGSSSADVLATARAVADSLQRKLPNSVIASIAVAAEQACDALMYDEPVLFAQEQGTVVEYLPGHLPAMKILGLDTDPSGTGVDTVTFPRPHYAPQELAEFGVLLAATRRALRDQDLRLLAHVATASTRVDQRYRPDHIVSLLLEGYRDLGALGVQRAHSGTVVGLVYAPDVPSATLARAESELSRLGIEKIWSFHVGHR